MDQLTKTQQDKIKNIMKQYGLSIDDIGIQSSIKFMIDDNKKIKE